MTRVSRRIFTAAAGVLALLAALPALADAAAGGGSAGFGGGGGGGFSGGGGGFSGGGGFGGSGGSGHLGLAGLLFLAIPLGILVIHMIGLFLRFAVVVPLRQRQEMVERAAAEAAEDDAAFSSENVHAAARSIFQQLEAAWSRGDRGALSRLVGDELMTEWNRRLDDFEHKGWRNVVEPRGEPTIYYVGLTNREKDEDDRVCVRIRTVVRDYVQTSHGIITKVGSSSTTTRLDEYWTLGKRDGGWILLSIEQPAEGEHELHEQIVATPWQDDERLHEQAVVEQAVADKAPEHYEAAELVSLDFEGNARAEALDLSLVDARFAPDVLETEVRRAVSAWAEAIDSDRGDLRAVASDEAASRLLFGDDRSGKSRLVVRGPRVQSMRLVALDPRADPPAISVDIEVRGARYVEDRDTTAVIAGSKSHETRFTERWTLTLDGSDEHPWRISGVATPASA